MIETERLWLRPPTAADLDDLVALNGDPVVMRYLDAGRPLSPDRVTTEELPRLLGHVGRADRLGYWLAADRSGRFVGWFGLVPTATPHVAELGYRLCRSAWGQGYATEGAQAMLDLGRTAGVRRVTATTMAVNDASRRVLERLGLHLVRTWVGAWPDPIDGWEQGEVDYAIDLR